MNPLTKEDIEILQQGDIDTNSIIFVGVVRTKRVQDAVAGLSQQIEQFKEKGSYNGDRTLTRARVQLMIDRWFGEINEELQEG